MMKNQALKAVFFDFDGTIANTEKLSVLATQQAFESVGLPIPVAQDIINYQGVPIETSFPKLSERQLSEEKLKKLFQLFRQAYQNNESEKNIKAYSGIPELLQQLVQQGIALFIMTSKKSAVAKRNLKLISCDQYFTDIYGSDRVAAFKPNPEGLLQALSEHQLLANQAVMIGDATFDIDAGHAAHMKTIAVTWGSHHLATLEAAQPDSIVTTREALADVLLPAHG
ncbi:HAD family hydrolase [Leuconostoc citreum]